MLTARVRMPTLTVGIIAKNEEPWIADCLKSVRPLADEILVVDTGSRDRTCSIARRLGAKILRHPWRGNFSEARNVYIRNASSDWILSLDADERISRQDLPMIRKLIRRGRVSGYLSRIRIYTSSITCFGQWKPLDGRYPAEEKRSRARGFVERSQVRLFRNVHGIAYDEKRRVWEDLREAILRAGGQIRPSRITIHDFGYLKGRAVYQKKQRTYFALTLKQIKENNPTAHELANAAIGYLTLGKNPARALELLRQAPARHRDAPGIHFMLAALSRETGKLKKALFHARRVARQTPREANVLWLLAVLLDNTGRYAEAWEAIRRALRLIPRHPLYLNTLGVIASHQDLKSAALRSFRQALRIHPGWEEARKNLAALRGGQCTSETIFESLP